MKLVEMLNPFKGKQTGEAPDEQAPISHESNGNIERVMRIYTRITKIAEKIVTDDALLWMQLLVNDYTLPKLTPPEINAVLQRLPSYTGRMLDYARGTLVNKLVRQYTEQDDLNLVIPPIKFNCLLADLVSHPERRIHVTLIGDPGENVAVSAKHCDIHIVGYAGAVCGSQSQHCTFEIDGDCGATCGYQSIGSTYRVHGDVNASMAQQATKCVFELDGLIAHPIGTKMKGCTFKVKLPESYERLKKYLPEDNTLILVPQ